MRGKLTHVQKVRRIKRPVIKAMRRSLEQSAKIFRKAHRTFGNSGVAVRMGENKLSKKTATAIFIEVARRHNLENVLKEGRVRSIGLRMVHRLAESTNNSEAIHRIAVSLRSTLGNEAFSEFVERLGKISGIIQPLTSAFHGEVRTREKKLEYMDIFRKELKQKNT